MNCFCNRPKSECADCSVKQAQDNLGKEYWEKMQTCFCTRADKDCEKCRAKSFDIEVDSRAFFYIESGSVKTGHIMGDSTEEHC